MPQDRMSDLTPLDRALLHRAIELAMRGRGSVEPNPMVGCVIAKNGGIIGEGYHQRFGGPHAEANALAACSQTPAGATAYVTLEPCCHTNKKTPPCVPALIRAKLARVVVGCQDPNPDVSGRGLAQLRDAGITVENADDRRCKQLLAPFIARTVYQRPYVTLKWAQTADGKVAGPAGRRIKISNDQSHRLVHELRARCDAILVGIGTIAQDNPLLTARSVPNARPLIRAVLDSDLRLSVDSQLVKTIDQGRVIDFCSKEAAEYSGTRVPLAAAGIEIHPVPSDSPGRLNLMAVLRQLGRMNVTHLLVEPGPTLAASFIASGMADRVWVFQSKRIMGDATAPSAVAVPYLSVGEAPVDGDRLIEYLNPASSVYFSAEPSADFPR